MGIPKKRPTGRGIYHPRALALDSQLADDPRGLWTEALRFRRWQEMRGYRSSTIEGRALTLRAFAVWASERGLTRPSEITKAILERWQRHLYLHRKQDGGPLSIHSQIAHTQPLLAFFKWLAKEGVILFNPASELELPRVARKLPRTILTTSEAERTLAAPNIATPNGLRDRAMLETLYSTGLRRSEIVNLSLSDIDRERGVVLVRDGKGGKDRIVPIGARALAWIDVYLAEVRPLFARGYNGDALFLSRERRPLRGGSLWKVAHHCVAQSGKTGACHAFRHTAATQMLEGGADIRFIQAMLGHASLSTTEIYTQVSIQSLKRVHAATHPAEAAYGGGGELPRVAFSRPEVSSDVSLAPRELAQLRASVAGVHARAARRARRGR